MGTISLVLRRPESGGEFRALGSGFALESRVAITAAHVVDQRETESLVFSSSDTTAPINITEVAKDDNFDVAVLQLASEVTPVLPVGKAINDLEWRVDTRPNPSDPALTGRVTDANIDYVNSRGRSMRVLQLHVQQELKDFHGYSGSPVQALNGAVLGVLIEQSLVRARVRAPEVKQATNVLFATPIEEVVRQFRLDPEWKAPLTNAIERRLRSAVERAGEVQNHIQDIRADVTGPLGFDLELISRAIVQQMTISYDGPSFLRSISRQDLSEEVFTYINNVEEAWMAVRIAKMDDEHGAEPAEPKYDPTYAVQWYQTALSNFVWGAEKELGS